MKNYLDQIPITSLRKYYSDYISLNLIQQDHTHPKYSVQF